MVLADTVAFIRYLHHQCHQYFYMPVVLICRNYRLKWVASKFGYRRSDDAADFAPGQFDAQSANYLPANETLTRRACHYWSRRKPSGFTSDSGASLSLPFRTLKFPRHIYSQPGVARLAKISQPAKVTSLSSYPGDIFFITATQFPPAFHRDRDCLRLSPAAAIAPDRSARGFVLPLKNAGRCANGRGRYTQLRTPHGLGSRHLLFKLSDATPRCRCTAFFQYRRLPDSNTSALQRQI